MSLLFSIFPQLNDWEGGDIPKWSEGRFPWQILEKDEDSLKSQITKLIVNESDVFIHPNASIGDFVTIEGPSFIGSNAIIRSGAYLRGGSWICEGALVGHCSEIKNSVLLPNSKAPHFNYVGDSVVGFGANLGAGVKLSNVRHDKSDIAVSLEDGTRIDSKLSKFGALVGDGAKIGCNAVTNPGAIIAPGAMIPPNLTVSGWFGTKS